MDHFTYMYVKEPEAYMYIYIYIDICIYIIIYIFWYIIYIHINATIVIGNEFKPPSASDESWLNNRRLLRLLRLLSW
jgi:hypothetical protein